MSPCTPPPQKARDLLWPRGGPGFRRPRLAGAALPLPRTSAPSIPVPLRSAPPPEPPGRPPSSASPPHRPPSSSRPLQLRDVRPTPSACWRPAGPAWTALPEEGEPAASGTWRPSRHTVGARVTAFLGPRLRQGWDPEMRGAQGSPSHPTPGFFPPGPWEVRRGCWARASCTLWALAAHPRGGTWGG